MCNENQLEKIRLVCICPMCTKETTVDISKGSYYRYLRGQFIQDAFPDLTAEVREQIKTGICPACWDDLFSDDEDEKYTDDDDDYEEFVDIDSDESFDQWIENINRPRAIFRRIN